MPVTVAISTPPRYTLYPVTAVSSVEADQVRLIWVGDTAVPASPVGTDGGVVSGAPDVHSMCSNGAAAGTPSKASATRLLVPVPVTMMASALLPAHPVRLTISWMTEERFGVL